MAGIHGQASHVTLFLKLFSARGKSPGKLPPRSGKMPYYAGVGDPIAFSHPLEPLAEPVRYAAETKLSREIRWPK